MQERPAWKVERCGTGFYVIHTPNPIPAPDGQPLGLFGKQEAEARCATLNAVSGGLSQGEIP